MNKLWLIIITLLTTALITATQSTAEVKPLKIGVMLCLSGACIETGTNVMRGIELAQEQINKRGGILGRQIKLVVQDTREMDSPANAVSAYRQLRLDPEIELFIGPSWTVGGLPVAPVAARDKVIVMAASIGLEGFNEASDNLFNLWPHDSVSTKALAKYAIDHGWKKVAILSNTHPWESALAKVFREEYKRLGGSEAAFFEFDSKDSNIRPMALKIKQANPDLIFMSNYTQLGLSGRAFKEIGLAVPMMTILLEDTEIKSAQGSLEGLIFAVYEQATKEFASQYQQKFGVPAGMASDTGYDTLFVYADAIERSKSFDHVVLKEELLRTQLNGASGRIVFDSRGGVIKTPMFQVLKGENRVPEVK